MSAVYLFSSVLIATGLSFAADANPQRAVQWAHTTRAYCASIAPAPCTPTLAIVIYSSQSELGYRVAITYKPSDAALPSGTLILYADQIQLGPIRGATGFQGAIVRYDPCLLDPGDISVQVIEATPLSASGPTIRSSEHDKVNLE